MKKTLILFSLMGEMAPLTLKAHISKTYFSDMRLVSSWTVTYKVRVATMTHDHDDTPRAIFNTISGTCWKVSEFIDFDLKN